MESLLRLTNLTYMKILDTQQNIQNGQQHINLKQNNKQQLLKDITFQLVEQVLLHRLPS